MRPIPPQALTLLNQFEGCDLTMYWDTAGLPTIGWGHRILPGEHFSVITQPQADALRTADLTPAAICVESHVTVPINDNEYGALVVLTFNIGGLAFAGSTLLRKLNAGDRTGAAAQFAVWNKDHDKTGKLVVVAGLVRRRAAEAKLLMG